jgi:hypothetical protein
MAGFSCTSTYPAISNPAPGSRLLSRIRYEHGLLKECVGNFALRANRVCVQEMTH